ncbi:MAG: SagB/ThcOx family dehydrogenase [Chloroflexi bacterium]|nr:SagB/ThcOx family dehydrogenase [Chloroflexota bacterium]MYB83529.1 SagB/ThcOx family dehydrogenase [Chloroflexota bacterium]
MTQSRSEAEAILAYHEATKHSVESVRRGGHMLDFTNMPRPWKLYDAPLPEVPLPQQLTRTGVSVEGALPGDRFPVAGDSELTLSNLASVLQLSAGVTKRLRAGNGYMYFRAAACTGALYHIELYVVSGPLSGLPAGVYQYGAHDNTLRMLRAGDFRAPAMQAAGLEHTPAAIVVYTSTFWRNSWKYGSRTYRHAFWDGGTILAHSMAAAHANGLWANLVTRYADAAINDVIDVDGETEVSVALLPLGAGLDAPPVDAPARLDMPVVPLSRNPIDYPLIREAHAATTLTGPSPVGSMEKGEGKDSASGGDLIPLGEGELLTRELEDVILRRGSSRRFAREPISLPALAAMLDAAARPTEPDGADAGEAFNDLYVIANAVDGLPEGIYRYRPSLRSLDPVSVSGTRVLSEHLDLDQPLGGDAAADLYFIADMPAVLDRWGARGYRTAHLDASIRAGRVYLAAYALGLGATGLTFYDDEVVEALGAAQGSAVTFLVAVGVPWRTRSAGG